VVAVHVGRQKRGPECKRARPCVGPKDSGLESDRHEVHHLRSAKVRHLLD
jgi:hypothetical protein